MPRHAAEPDRKFPLTDMPAGLMADLVTRLDDHLLIRRVVRRTGRFRTPRRSAMAGERESGDDSIARVAAPSAHHRRAGVLNALFMPHRARAWSAEILPSRPRQAPRRRGHAAEPGNGPGRWRCRAAGGLV